MRIVSEATGMTIERGLSKEARENAAKFIMAHVRCRYTPQSKARAKAFAKQG